MLTIEIINGICERTNESEALRRTDARPILHVTALIAEIPVHRRNAVVLKLSSGCDRRRTHRGDGGKRHNTIINTDTTPKQFTKDRRSPFTNRTPKHPRIHRIDNYEYQFLTLFHHHRVRS